MWNQIYNPLGNAGLSTIAAAIPVVTLLVLIASGKVKAHIAAIIALIVANIITIFIFTMPANMSIRASLLEVRDALLIAIALVVAVVFAFLGSVRSSMITLVTIPLSLVGAWMGLRTAGRLVQRRREEERAASRQEADERGRSDSAVE